MINDITLLFISELLNIPPTIIASSMENTLEVELLLDFLLHVRLTAVAESCIINNWLPLAIAWR